MTNTTTERTENLRVNVNSAEKAALRDLAAAEGVSMATWIRARIRESAPQFFNGGRSLDAIIADALASGRDEAGETALSFALLLIAIALGLVAWGLSAQVLATWFLAPLMAAFGSLGL